MRTTDSADPTYGDLLAQSTRFAGEPEDFSDIPRAGDDLDHGQDREGQAAGNL